MRPTAANGSVAESFAISPEGGRQRHATHGTGPQQARSRGERKRCGGERNASRTQALFTAENLPFPQRNGAFGGLCL